MKLEFSGSSYLIHTNILTEFYENLRLVLFLVIDLGIDLEFVIDLGLFCFWSFSKFDQIAVIKPYNLSR